VNEPLIPVSEEVAAKENADRLIETAFRDPSPIPSIGTAPPVAQPGIPPQSKAAVDYAVRALATGVTSVLCSGSVALVMAASQVADPVVCGIVAATPIGLAFPIAALSGLAKRWKQAAPGVTVNNYNGTVHQQTTHTENRGVWAKNINRH
jgi:hypothetical protein